MSPFGRSCSLSVLGCIALVAPSCVYAAPEPQEEPVSTERQVQKKFIVKLEPPQQRQYCSASSTIEYLQNDDIATVSGEITNKQCGASSGTYTMNIRYRDQDGDLHELDFEESWQREDDQSVKFKREYAIGENVDLIRIRTRRMRCVCAEIESKGETEIQE